MKSNKWLLSLAVGFLCCGSAYAQTTVKGTITSESGEPLIGATIAVKNSTDGTVTDIDGNYSLKTKKTLSSKDLLLFSYVGYKTLQKNYTGNTMNVKLAEESQQLNDVVVTALGIKRGEKGLGYATETVKGDKITSALPSNWSTALNGKVAGLSVISSGGPLNSSRISLRGDVSLNQNGNDALVVVDGVPMSSPMTNPGVAYGAGSNSELSVDYGNGFSDINPDDIESIQVLKGASATALYGTRAANGVIMVTTKSGAGAPKGIGVSYSGNFSIDDVMRWPDYQYEFGQGLPSNIGPAGSIYEGEPYYSYGKAEDGSYASTSGTSSAYGARFDANRKFYQYDPVTQGRASEATPWVAYKNNRKDLFQTGYTITNSVALTGKSDRGSVRASITHTKNEWILPNTGFQRITAMISAQQQISRALRINFKSSYTYRKLNNTPALGYNSNSISYFLIFQNPNVNLDWLRPMWRTGQENVKQLQPYSSFIGNPYVILYESENPSEKHSNVSSVSANLRINSKFDFMIRSGIQLSADQREQHRPISDVVFGNGFFKKQNVKDYVGLPSGYQTLPSITASGLNQEMAKAPMKLAMMPYAEVEFIKAELLKKGVIDGGSNAAKEAYQKGVQAAIEQWGQVLPDNYFENPEAAYDDTLERIMNQKFVALFFCDYQQWFEYNRTGFPVLPVGPGIANANNQMPKRFKYPAALQRTNLKNYQAAKQNMGGDDFNIRLMWQQ